LAGAGDDVLAAVEFWVAESVAAVEAGLLLLHAAVTRRLPTIKRPNAASFLST
jgi:hypothetical protein